MWPDPPPPSRKKSLLIFNHLRITLGSVTSLLSKFSTLVRPIFPLDHFSLDLQRFPDTLIFTMPARRRLFVAPKPTSKISTSPETPEIVTTPAQETPPLVTKERRTFRQWLDSPEGRDCANPRLPTDYTRLSVELEDRLRRAFEAGGAA